MTATENMTIRLFNYEPTLSCESAFNFSYSIHFGASVNELLTLGNTLLRSSTLAYAFVTTAESK